MKKQKTKITGQLVSLGNRTPEERREICRLGGVKSGEVRRERATIKSVLLALLKLPMHKGPIDGLDSLGGAEGRNLSALDALAVAAMQRALKGDVAAMVFIRDTIGEKPGEQLRDVPEESTLSNLTDEELWAIIADGNG